MNKREELAQVRRLFESNIEDLQKLREETGIKENSFLARLKNKTIGFFYNITNKFSRDLVVNHDCKPSRGQIKKIKEELSIPFPYIPSKEEELHLISGYRKLPHLKPREVGEQENCLPVKPAKKKGWSFQKYLTDIAVPVAGALALSVVAVGTLDNDYTNRKSTPNRQTSTYTHIYTQGAVQTPQLPSFVEITIPAAVQEQRRVHVVKKGENMWKIASQYTDNVSASMNEFCKANGKKPLYSKFVSKEEDANYLKVGQELDVSVFFNDNYKAPEKQAPEKQIPVKLVQSNSLENRVILENMDNKNKGLEGKYVNSQRKDGQVDYTKEEMNRIIDIKNRYSAYSLDRIALQVEKDLGINFAQSDLATTLESFARLAANNPDYSDIARINYDHRLASNEMKLEMTELFQNSELTLDGISDYIHSKYGMHASGTTISKYARQDLGVNSRREAKEKYTESH